MTPVSTVKPRPPRTIGGAALGQETSREAKRLAAAILEVLAGERTPAQAAQALAVSLPRYYQLEAAALRGLLAACAPRPKGRQANGSAAVAALRRQCERLQRDLARQQSLVRLTQRAAGLAAPVPAAKEGSKKARKRKPAARALLVAKRLRTEEATVAAASDNGSSQSE